MTKCYQKSFEFPRVNRRIVEARFDGGDITSDGGVLLLRQADRLTGLSDSIARALSDPRRQASCDHDVPGLVRQRLYAIALGYEDLNDHDGLRQDVALQTAVERDQWLASASTLCRFENRADRETAWRLSNGSLVIDSWRRCHRRIRPMTLFETMQTVTAAGDNSAICPRRSRAGRPRSFDVGMTVFLNLRTRPR